MPKVFYSWQSWLPNNTNRSFIHAALKSACKTLGRDLEEADRPEVDKDTQGVPGSPDIAHTIFDKIDAADVVVVDVSIVQSKEARHCPNPNVLVELGYAVKTHGWPRIVLVMNTAFGGPDVLPFDLRGRRTMTFNMPPEVSERAVERKKLESGLVDAVGASLKHAAESAPHAPSPPSPGEVARLAIDAGKPNAASAVRQYMRWFGEQLDVLAPKKADEHADEAFVQALDGTVELLTDFGALAETIASHKATSAGVALVKGFEHVLSRYEPRVGFSGSFGRTGFDLAKFVGHEALVMFVGLLMREEHWAMLAEILEQRIIVESARETELLPYTRIATDVDTLEQRRVRLKSKSSLRADLLKERHSEGRLLSLVPVDEFLSADFFLFLRSVAQHDNGMVGHAWWYPYSAVYMARAQPPRYLVLATKRTYAEELAPALGLIGASALREWLTKIKPDLPQMVRGDGVFWWDGPLEFFEPSTIGRE